MSKKYTIKDVAAKAGVSVATVSYVINERHDKRISDETRKKVLQIINLLNYKPNSSAKSLATNKTYKVALYVTKEDSLYKRSEQLYIIETLTELLKNEGYRLILSHESDIFHIDYADALLCYDITNEQFQIVGDKNLIPMLSIDSLIDIPLFFQVCTDYSKLKEEADVQFGKDNYIYVCLAPNNLPLRNLILEVFTHVQFMENDIDLVKHEDNSDSNYMYNQRSLHSIFCDSTALYLPCNLNLKINQVIECMKLAMNRVENVEHNFFI